MPWIKQGTLAITSGVQGGGSWRASTTDQEFRQGTITRVLLNTALRTPVGITSNDNGTWTINKSGWWDFSGLCDLAMVAGYYQEWVIAVRNVTQDLTVAADQFFWVKDAYTSGNAAGTFYCNADDLVEFTGVFYIDTGVSRTYKPVSTTRASFTALYRGEAA